MRGYADRSPDSTPRYRIPYRIASPHGWGGPIGVGDELGDFLIRCPQSRPGTSADSRQLRRTETKSQHGTMVGRTPGAALQVGGVEDKGFEPLKGCPQRAFQLCGAPSVPCSVAPARHPVTVGGRQRTPTGRRNETGTKTDSSCSEVGEPASCSGHEQVPELGRFLQVGCVR